MPLAVAALSLLGGCFTSPINGPPEKPKIAPVDTVRRGEPASFTIVRSDPDRDAVAVTWGTHSGDCPADPAAPIPEDWEPRSLPPTTDARATVDAKMTQEPFCVCAVAVDSHGATSADCFAADPRNGAPIADIKVLEPASMASYPLYSNFKLSGVDSFDPIDPLMFFWTFTRPPSSSAKVVDCANDPQHKQFCFTADVPGTYQVSLAVSDGHGGMGTAEQPLIVLKDRLPCIQATLPDFVPEVVLPPLNNEFSVEVVDDDGEPYPQRPDRPAPHFAWSLRHGNDPLIHLQGNDFHKLPVAPTEFAEGERAQVRVEISDENAANQETIRRQLATCLDAPDCAAAPGCLQRVSWTVQY